MELDTDRRRLLELAGTGTALSLAGCSALQGDAGNGTETRDTTENSTDTTAEGTSDGEEKVAVAVQANQQELQQRQQEVRSELESGNISRSEAQQQVQSAQVELRSEAVTSFTQRVSSNSGLTVDDSVDQLGILLISGSATALIDTLSFDEVNGLLPRETFQQAKAQAQQQTGTSTSSN